MLSSFRIAPRPLAVNYPGEEVGHYNQRVLPPSSVDTHSTVLSQQLHKRLRELNMKRKGRRTKGGSVTKWARSELTWSVLAHIDGKTGKKNSGERTTEYRRNQAWSMIVNVGGRKSKTTTPGQSTTKKHSEAIARNVENEAQIASEFQKPTLADGVEATNNPQAEELSAESPQFRRNRLHKALRSCLHARIENVIPKVCHPRIVRNITEDGTTIWRPARISEWHVDLLERLFELAKMVHNAESERKEFRPCILAAMRACTDGRGPNAENMHQPGLIVENAVAAIEKWQEDHQQEMFHGDNTGGQDV